jgi:hypothetical protein
LQSLLFPFYIDEETGEFETGQVTIAIPNGNHAAFHIEALPDTGNLETGSVVKAYLEAILDSFKAHLLYMDDLEADYGFDTGQMKDQIELQIDDIESTLAELEISGTVSNHSEFFGSSALSESELRVVDQLLYAILSGLYLEGGSASAASLNKELPTLEEAMEYFRRGAIMNPGTWLPGTNENIKTNTNAMEAALELLSRKGGAIGRAAYSRLAKPFVKLAKLVVQGTSAMLTDGERFAREGLLTLSEEAKALVRKIYETYGPAILLETEGHYNKLSPIVKAILKKKCEIGVGDYSFFCDNPGKSRLQVASAAFKQTVAQSGTEARLIFSIDEVLVSPDFAKNSHIFIDWGDGNQSDLNWGESHSRKALIGKAELGHTYHLPSDIASQTFTARVSVKGDNVADFSPALSASVKIVSSIDSIRIDINGPTTLNVNQLGKWTMDVSGGFGPYHGTLSWEGGASVTAVSQFGEFKASHRYPTAGRKTITLRVVDSDGAAATINHPVVVIGETGDCQLDYWLYYVTPGVGEIVLSGDPDFPTITWSRTDGKAASELYIESNNNSSNVYNLQGDIPNVVTYGDYSYPGTSVGPYEYCYNGRLCTDVIPFSEIRGGEYGYEIWIVPEDYAGDSLRATFYIYGEVCPE